MHRDFGKMENLTAGKGWAVGYEPCQMAIRRRAARHFDVRDLFSKSGGIDPFPDHPLGTAPLDPELWFGKKKEGK